MATISRFSILIELQLQMPYPLLLSCSGTPSGFIVNPVVYICICACVCDTAERYAWYAQASYIESLALDSGGETETLLLKAPTGDGSGETLEILDDSSRRSGVCCGGDAVPEGPD